MELVIVYAAVFVGALLVFERLMSFIASRVRRSRSLNRRLGLLETTESTLEVYRTMVKERGLDYDRAGSRPLVLLRRLFAQSGLKLDYSRLFIYAPMGAAVAWFLLAFLGLPTVTRLVVVMTLLVILPIAMVLKVRSSRIRKFTAQLPGALDVVNRSLSAGHPVPTAISLVARELPDPVGTEFGMLSDELTYGTDLDVAMLNMIERVGAEDLKLLAVSMSVQRGTVEILSRFSRTLPTSCATA